MLDKLPGCINITPGPADATISDIVCGATATQPAVLAGDVMGNSTVVGGKHARSWDRSG